MDSLWFILLILGGAIHRYGECRRDGERGWFYLAIIGYLIGTLIWKYLA